MDTLVHIIGGYALLTFLDVILSGKRPELIVNFMVTLVAYGVLQLIGKL